MIRFRNEDNLLRLPDWFFRLVFFLILMIPSLLAVYVALIEKGR